MSDSTTAQWQAARGPSLPGRIERARTQATQRGGRCTVRFSQSLPPVVGILKLDEKTREGVCLTLVYRWFVEMAKPAPRFWPSVFTPDGRIQSAFLGTIMVQQISPGRVHVAAQGTKGDAREAPAYSHNALTSEGFKCMGLDEDSGGNAVKIAAKTLRAFLQAVIDAGDHAQYFLQMNLKYTAAAGGHAIGAKVTKEGVITIMDPNLGELGFPDPQSAYEWMKKDLSEFYTRYDKLSYMFWKKP